MTSDSIRPTSAADAAGPPTPADGPGVPQGLVIRAGGGTFVIPVEQVTEVVRPDGLLPVPGAPFVQAGIVNVRGAIVTVLDLQALLTGGRAAAPGSIVLLEYGVRPVGLAVDAVFDVRGMGEAPLAGPVEPLDAVALVAGHLHSAEERER